MFWYYAQHPSCSAGRDWLGMTQTLPCAVEEQLCEKDDYKPWQADHASSCGLAADNQAG